MPTLLATRYAGIGWPFIDPSNQPWMPCTSALNRNRATSVATVFTAEKRATSPVSRRRRLRIGLATERLPPGPVLPVPVDGVRQTFREADRRSVAEFGTDLGDVDRVAQVVPEPVLDVLDLVPTGAGGLEQQPGQLFVGQFGTAADVVDLAV